MNERIDRVCAAILQGDTILMVHIDYGDRAVWTLPGGEIEAGESPEEAVIREVAEEACVQCRVVCHLYTRVFQAVRHDVVETCYLVELALDQQPAPGFNPGFESQRFTAVGWRPLADLEEDIQVSQVLAALRSAPADSGRRDQQVTPDRRPA